MANGNGSIGGGLRMSEMLYGALILLASLVVVGVLALAYPLPEIEAADVDDEEDRNS